MGAYNFKPQFEPDIQADRKRHTIRDKRKDGRRPKVGEVLSLYVGMRQKGMCRLLKRRRCVKIQEIAIKGFFSVFAGFTGGLFIDGQQLIYDELQALARSDGFPNFDDMMDFWRGRLPFKGDLIHWESDAEAAKNPISETPRRKRASGQAQRGAKPRSASKHGEAGISRIGSILKEGSI